MNKLIQSGDVSRAFQLAKAAIVAVDEADKRSRPVDQDQLNDKKKRVSSQNLESVNLIGSLAVEYLLIDND